jgi:hypothetical protein
MCVKTKNKNTTVDEIDAIRIDFYEKTKHMSTEENLSFIKQETEPINEKYCFKPTVRIDEEVAIRTKLK